MNECVQTLHMPQIVVRCGKVEYCLANIHSLLPSRTRDIICLTDIRLGHMIFLSVMTADHVFPMPCFEFGVGHVTGFIWWDAGRLHTAEVVWGGLPSCTFTIVLRQTPTLPKVDAAHWVWDLEWTESNISQNPGPARSVPWHTATQLAQPRTVSDQATRWQRSESTWPLL